MENHPIPTENSDGMMSDPAPESSGAIQQQPMRPNQTLNIINNSSGAPQKQEQQNNFLEQHPATASIPRQSTITLFKSGVKSAQTVKQLPNIIPSGTSPKQVLVQYHSSPPQMQQQLQYQAQPQVARQEQAMTQKNLIQKMDSSNEQQQLQQAPVALANQPQSQNQPQRQAVRQQPVINQSGSNWEQQMVQNGGSPTEHQQPGQSQVEIANYSPPQPQYPQHQHQTHAQPQTVRRQPSNQNITQRNSIREQQLIQRLASPNQQQLSAPPPSTKHPAQPQRQFQNQDQSQAQRQMLTIIKTPSSWEQKLIEKIDSRNQQQETGQYQVDYTSHPPQQQHPQYQPQKQPQGQPVRRQPSNQTIAPRNSIREQQLMQRLSSPNQQQQSWQPPQQQQSLYQSQRQTVRQQPVMNQRNSPNQQQQSPGASSYSALQNALQRPKTTQVYRVVPLPPQQRSSPQQSQMQQQYGQEWQPYTVVSPNMQIHQEQRNVVPKKANIPPAKYLKSRKRQHKKQQMSYTSGSPSSPYLAKRARSSENELNMEQNEQIGTYTPSPPNYEILQERKIATDPNAPLPDLTWIIGGHEIRVIRSKDPSMRVFPDYAC